MENINECIIVTWDFTPLSENAFAHALLSAKTLKLSIKILHIVGKKKEVDIQLEKLKIDTNETAHP